MKSNKKVLNNSKSLISIIMPVYNAGDFLVEAIDSIRKQTYKHWELIIVDDGSTDNSKEILKKYTKKDLRIKLFIQSHKGLSYALNYGLNKAKGSYIARMDADDISYPQRLEKQLSYLFENPDVVLVGTQVQTVNKNGKKISRKSFPLDHTHIYELMMVMMPVQHATILVRSKHFKHVAYQNHTTAEDVSLLFKLLQTGKFANTKEVLYQYRIRKNSNSHKSPKKTFYLTFKSRIKALTQWGYKPSLAGCLINVAQLILISILPNSAILSLYQFIRMDSVWILRRIRNLLKRTQLLRSNKAPAILVK